VTRTLRDDPCEWGAAPVSIWNDELARLFEDVETVLQKTAIALEEEGQ
jgi:hypothetical protein